MIENSKQTIENYKNYDDEWSRRYLMQEQDNLEIYNYLRDNNVEPLYGWEYEAYNYMTSLMQFLGAGLLVCGIAVFMSDIVSGECTPATLKFLLVQPVTRGKVLLSKFIAVTLTGKWRIRVSTLLTLAAVGGSAGALLAMHLFHHKTRKKKFTIGVPLMLLVQIALFFFLVKADFSISI